MQARTTRLQGHTHLAGHLVTAELQGWVPWFVTLTYADPEAWEPGHVAKLRERLRDRFRRQDIEAVGVWVCEVQPGRFKRTGKAVPHYHAIVWLPHGVRMPKPDSEGWWPHGMTNVQPARNPVGYLLKYASKGGLLQLLPKGLRAFGNFGLGQARRIMLATLRRPAWLRRATDNRVCRLVRQTRVGWLDPETGEVYRSPWRCVWWRGTRWLIPATLEEEPCGQCS